MKVIFLDIDGVLNNQNHILKLINLLGREQYFTIVRALHESPFDYGSCLLLQQLIIELDLKVVLSSTWRRNTKSKDLIKKYAGIEIMDTTPVLSSSIRGEEIQQYLDTHGKITNYVILDDDSDILDSQKDHFVKVDGKVGLTIKEIIQCEEILNMEE